MPPVPSPPADLAPLPPKRDVPWVLRRFTIGITLAWTVMLLISTAYLIAVENRLDSAAAAGLQEVLLPKGSLYSAQREINRQLEDHRLDATRPLLLLQENGRPVTTLSGSRNSLVSIRVAVPIESLLSPGWQTITLLADETEIVGRNQLSARTTASLGIASLYSPPGR